MLQSQLKNEKEVNNNSQFCHVLNELPEANLIFESLQHKKKSIYPFEMKSIIHPSVYSQQEQYSVQTSDYVFKSTLSSVREHFQTKYLIYDKFNNNKDDDLFNMNIYPVSKLKNLKNQDYVINIQQTSCFSLNSKQGLSFDSRFQSGNLSLVSYVEQIGIHTLLLHNDINTSGYTNWFYFRVKNNNKGKYKFAIMNYGKAGWQFNQGIKICYNKKYQGWKRGGSNIHCQSNRNLFQKGSLLNFNTLYFQFEFQEDNSEIFFAYNVPYTYNDLCCFLDQIQLKKSPYFHRKITGLTLAGNRLQLISITNFKKLNETNMNAIVFIARSHPGETVSSWVMQNLINFLLSDKTQAQLLRDNFVFKIIPMLNPDGVIHGNYRCSLSGRDLNRRWGEPNKQYFPEIYYAKNQILQLHKRRKIKLFIDLHGHTQKKNFFVYGCNDKHQPHRCRLFPYILSKSTQIFSFKCCNFCLDRSKIGTARICMFKELKIPYVYTMQGSQFGTDSIHHNYAIFTQIAYALSKGILCLFRIKYRINKKIQGKNQQFQSQTQEQQQNLQAQLLNDPNLLKIGNDKDAGSDSEPSVDNISYDKLKNLNQRKSLKINSSIKKIINTSRPHNSLSKLENQVKIEKSRPRTTQNLRNSIKMKKNLSQKANTPALSFSSDKIYRKSRNASQQLQKNRNLTQKSSPSHTQRKTQAVNFINLSISINDDLKKRNRTFKTASIIPVQKEFKQEQRLLRTMKMTTKNFYIFRRRK